MLGRRLPHGPIQLQATAWLLRRLPRTHIDSARLIACHAAPSTRSTPDLMRGRFEAVIEHATGRRVIGLMSGNQQHPDIMCEVFILDPTDLVDDHEIASEPPSSA